MGELVALVSQKLRGRGIKSNDEVKFDGESLQASENMKKVVSNYFMLVSTKLEEGEEYVMYTDAGERAAGAVLVRRNIKANMEKPIEFESQVFNEAQQKYLLLELRSDSRTIVAYLKNAGGVPDVMIMKWVAYAQMYNVEIEHIPREENFLANALTKFGRYCLRMEKEDIKEYITKKLEKECEKCQRYTRKQKETIWGTRPVRGVMEEVAIDHLIIGPNQQNYQLLVGQCTFSGWIEARLVNSTRSELVIEFLIEEIYGRHGIVQTVFANSGTTSARSVKQYVESRGSEMKITLPQNP
ncbi:hypothetical protein HMI54_006812 [Coelomomyces lativittatus]|nr:hypothetical protein HMI54_006812 [Coelomomyces lativittatus]